jgi:biopolymer transport protein ExbD/biopolymer transport protein TolR
MAFGRLERSSGPQPMSDINMTPLIDVMMVLLVIFMITAPLMTSSLKLDLPKTEGAAPSDEAAFVAVAIDPQGALFIADQPLSRPEFIRRITAAAHDNPQVEVQLRADKAVPYGRVAEVLGLIREAGLSRIGFVTEAASSTP